MWGEFGGYEVQNPGVKNQKHPQPSSTARYLEDLGHGLMKGFLLRNAKKQRTKACWQYLVLVEYTSSQTSPRHKHVALLKVPGGGERALTNTGKKHEENMFGRVKHDKRSNFGLKKQEEQFHQAGNES